MRIVLYIVILATLFFAPLQRIEIANLEPVQAVWMYRENGKFFLETDTKDKGSGITVMDAIADMKHNSSGIIYLDTAQYLFVSEMKTDAIRAVQSYLKKTVRMCIWDGQGELKTAVKYADTHKLGLKIDKWDGVGNLPELPPIKQEN